MIDWGFIRNLKLILLTFYRVSYRSTIVPTNEDK